MKRVYGFAITLFLMLGLSLWAEDDAEDASSAQSPVPYALLNNDYYRESLRQRNLARLTLQEGDYDTSAWHSAEAERYAALSNAYIERKLLEARLGTALQNAADRLSWARAHEAESYFPAQLQTAQAHYNIALGLRADGELQGALENAIAAVNDLIAVAAPPPRDERGKLILPPDLPSEPEQYAVRPWDIFGDCFWNIAARFYGDPFKWPVIYAANKHKIPEIDNPNLIEVGTLIDIPNISGGKRAGVYDTGKPYPQP